MPEDLLGIADANALQEDEKTESRLSDPVLQHCDRAGQADKGSANGQSGSLHNWGGLGQDREVELKSESESDIEQIAAGPGFLTDWPGDFRFKLRLPASGKAREPQYSAILNKLYIAQNRAVTLTLSTSAPSNSAASFSLRAQLAFTSPDHQKDPVRVCYQHSHTGGGTPKNDALASHILRLTAGEPLVDVKYLHFTDTGKHAVLVSPLPPPAPGTTTVPITIRFTDLSSCPGGINRREIAVVFTLESEGRVVGRKVLPVRVCTCPKRDREHDEKERGGGGSSGRAAGDKRAPPDSRETLVQSQSQGGEVQQPSTSGVADEFWVLARGPENYKALRQVRLKL